MVDSQVFRDRFFQWNVKPLLASCRWSWILCCTGSHSICSDNYSAWRNFQVRLTYRHYWVHRETNSGSLTCSHPSISNSESCSFEVQSTRFPFWSCEGNVLLLCLWRWPGSIFPPGNISVPPPMLAVLCLPIDNNMLRHSQGRGAMLGSTQFLLSVLV